MDRSQHTDWLCEYYVHITITEEQSAIMVKWYVLYDVHVVNYNWIQYIGEQNTILLYIILDDNSSNEWI